MVRLLFLFSKIFFCLFALIIMFRFYNKFLEEKCILLPKEKLVILENVLLAEDQKQYFKKIGNDLEIKDLNINLNERKTKFLSENNFLLTAYVLSDAQAFEFLYRALKNDAILLRFFSLKRQDDFIDMKVGLDWISKCS